jgi:hypothetical protein
MLDILREVVWLGFSIKFIGSDLIGTSWSKF